MRIFSAALFLLWAMPFLSHAATTFDVSAAACSGTLLTEVADVISVDCSGDLSLAGGMIGSDSEIRLGSLGSMQLDELSIYARHIGLSAGNALSIGARVVLDASTGGGISLSAGSIDIAREASISVGGVAIAGDRTDAGAIRPVWDGQPGSRGQIEILASVPEADTPMQLLVGLPALGALLRTRLNGTRPR